MASVDIGILHDTSMINSIGVTRRFVNTRNPTTLQKVLMGVKVLVVEDTMDSQVLVKSFLEKAGAFVECADNGEEGIKKALTSNHDIVLMDIEMDGVDGYTATTHLRTCGYSKPIIAFTAHAMKEQKDKCFACGCNAYISKPITRENLVQTIVHNLDSSVVH